MSRQINSNDLDPKFAYIQVIYVTPYFDEKELASRVTDFERNNNVRRFMYELPFTRAGKEHGNIEEQHKRRFIITSELCLHHRNTKLILGVVRGCNISNNS